MEVDGEGGGGVNLSSLQQLFSREYTHLYLKMADTARLQSNYAVAKRYLQLTEAAVGEVRIQENFHLGLNHSGKSFESSSMLDGFTVLQSVIDCEWYFAV